MTLFTVYQNFKLYDFVVPVNIYIYIYIKQGEKYVLIATKPTKNDKTCKPYRNLENICLHNRVGGHFLTSLDQLDHR